MPKIACFVVLSLLIAAATTLVAQGPPFPGGRNARGSGDVVAASVSKMMAFDADQDGKLSKTEVTDSRLQPLFERADADKDGTVTKDELTALFTREASSLRAGGPGGPPGGPDRADGPGRFGPPGAPDGRGQFGPPEAGRGGPPRPGEILPGFLQDELQLTRRQKAQLEKLQQDVDARLAKILTEEQFQRLNEMSRPGAGGRPRGGPDGFGPPGERRDADPPPR
ncbi:MAG TPA: EF-hand domain-containing protein [Pirellulales bacterium]|nr:EF-hand domain-containing protein [Pirellulales bacterium]